MGSTIASILPWLVEGLKLAPDLVNTGKEVVEGVKQIWENVTADEVPTPDQQDEFEAALNAAHERLQKDLEC